MSRLVTLAICALALGACDKKKENGGLPPAKDWHKPGSAGEAAGGGGGESFHGSAPSEDPHAGMDMGGRPDDPHAGMENPHGTGGMGGGGGGGGGGGMPPGMSPDPNRKVDPNNYVRGTIKIAAAVKSKVKAGGVLFLSAKRPDPKTGEGVGMPLAVQKLEVQPGGQSFDLSEANAMMMGTEPLAGDVVVTAWFDQDGDPIKQPGDVVGKARVKIPAKDVVITLDTVVP